MSLTQMVAKTNLKGMTPEEIRDFLAPHGVPSYRSGQIVEWIYGRGVSSFAEMTNLPKLLRDRLEEAAEIQSLEVVNSQASRRDGPVKYLFRCADGARLESVWLPHDYGNNVCVSTQIGCRMGCRFCASTITGCERDLSAGEIVDQVLRISRHLPPDQRVRSVVFMGMGEPLENYDQVVKAMRLLHLPKGSGIGYRNQTISTSGIIPGILRLAGEGLPVTLSVSLHAANDELRSRLMPVNRRYPIVPLLAACDDYAEATGRRVTYEYILIRGANDSPAQAAELANLLRGRLAHVNLIPANPVPEIKIAPSDPRALSEFQSVLERSGVKVTLRREMGRDIDAACGQLRRRAQRGE